MRKKSSHPIEHTPSASAILELLQKRPLKLNSVIKLTGWAKKEINRILAGLEHSGKIIRLSGGLWTVLDDDKYIRGRYKALPFGGGAVTPDDGSPEIQISGHNFGGAWDKDIVRVQVISSCPLQGKIIAIEKRTQKEVPGRVFKRDGKNLLCKTIGKGKPVTFIVRADKTTDKKLPKNSLVTIHPDKMLAPDLWQGSFVRYFEDEDCIDTQEALVKCAYDVPSAFPELALNQASALPSQPAQKDIQGREDLRGVPFVTIDGPDAKDFDDAIYVEKTKTGWLLRVAIADVSHYVLPDPDPQSLDGEALRRGNSWYFPHSVEPMLPHILSSGLCSLKPDEDRLAMMAEITFDHNGRVKNTRFAPIVMRSQARLTYPQVNRLFTHPDNFLPPEITKMLQEAHTLYKKLAQIRHERGTLDFELPEPAYQFDDDGHLLHLGHAQRNDAHRLIEEFMIAANEAVASRLGEENIPLPYRVHPQPEMGKIKELYDTLQLTAVETLPAGVSKESLADPKTIQKILENAKSTPSENIVNKLCLRSLTQARYQPENVGHFGLASVAYCHFTSPIRRYADLLVHRSLKAKLGIISKNEIKNPEELTRIGTQLNKLEREALECEREMTKRLGCLAMKDRIGETIKGTISGVTDFGLFVEFDDVPAEGLIRINELGNDWYNFDQKAQMLIGEHTGQIWRLGQPVEVKILDVDIDRQEIPLKPAGDTPLKDTVKRSPQRDKKHWKNPKGKKNESQRKTHFRPGK